MGGKPAMEGMFHMTYDPGPKEYVLLWVDNMGAYSKENSSGWEGDKIVFSDDNRQLRETRDSCAGVKLSRFRLGRLARVRDLPGRREWNTLCGQHAVRSEKEHPTCPSQR